MASHGRGVPQRVERHAEPRRQRHAAGWPAVRSGAPPAPRGSRRRRSGARRLRGRRTARRLRTRPATRARTMQRTAARAPAEQLQPQSMGAGADGSARASRHRAEWRPRALPQPARSRTAGSSGRSASPPADGTRGGSGSISHGCTQQVTGSPRGCAARSHSRRVSAARAQAPASAERHLLAEPPLTIGGTSTNRPGGGRDAGGALRIMGFRRPSAAPCSNRP